MSRQQPVLHDDNEANLDASTLKKSCVPNMQELHIQA